MNGYVIRDAISSDREQIGLLWLYLMQYHSVLDERFHLASDASEAYEKHAMETMRSKNGRVIVAQDVATSEIVAFALGEVQSRPSISIPGTYGFLSDLYVVEEWRKGGVGRAMFEEMKRWFVERKVVAVELYVSLANIEAISFWKEMGLSPFLQLMHMNLNV